MYLLTKGRLVNLDTGVVIIKNEYYKEKATPEERAKSEIVIYSLHRTGGAVWREYDDGAKRDKVFNDLVTRIKKTEEVFEL